jgi:predicted O-linked N-acetylglucosamine transferase (SPINDLY family)
MTAQLPEAADPRFDQALACHRQGRLDEAERLYRAVLVGKPEHVDALHLLGVIALQRKRFDAAVQLIGRALKLAPAHAAAQSNLGAALLELGRNEEALASFDRALAALPDYPEALNNRGAALRRLDRHEAALASYERALALKPDYAEAWRNRGHALHDLGRHEAALASYERALALAPGDIEALNRRGNVLLALGRPGAALASYLEALAIRPESAELLNNCGIAETALGRLDDALARYDQALAIAPGYAEALNNRGAALLELRRPDAALASFDRALALRPDYVDALTYRGVALRQLDRYAEALDSLDRALGFDPRHAGALTHRAELLRRLDRHAAAASDFAQLMKLAPQTKYLKGELLHERLHCADWQHYDRDVAEIVAECRAGHLAATPFALLSIAVAPQDQLRAASAFVADRFAAALPALWTGERYRHDRIRLAYLSADFHEHATAYLTAELFETHDRDCFDLTAFSFGPAAASPMRRRLEAAFPRFIDGRFTTDPDAARALRALEIDVAVDLKGFTAGSRPGIMARRPAPVQVSYLGFPGTMAAGFIDYLIADRFVVPEADRRCYTESIVYLPDSYQPNDTKRAIADATPTRAAAGLPETGFVFCCFNNTYKITPPMFDIWMRLLRRVPGSVLWLLAVSPATIHNFRRNALDRGIAAERLIFAPRLPLPEHLARHRLAGLLLDTLPYNAHTSASDALWAGLPVVTCAGDGFAGRVAGSLLHAVGLPELVTASLDECEALALALAQNPERLAALKAKLAQRREISALFDIGRFRRHLEQAYATMHERHQRGQKPESFAVAPRPAA